MDPARANKWNDITDASEIYVSSMRAFTIHTCAFSDLVKRSSPRSLQSAVTNLVPTSKGEGEKIKLSFIACEHQFGNRSFAFHGSRTRARSNEISRDKTNGRTHDMVGRNIVSLSGRFAFLSYFFFSLLLLFLALERNFGQIKKGES